MQLGWAQLHRQQSPRDAVDDAVADDGGVGACHLLTTAKSLVVLQHLSYLLLF